jgi:class 3 adenylate cyclase
LTGNVTGNVTVTPGNVTSNVTVTPCNATDIDKDIDRDREKEKEIDSIATAPAARAAAVSKSDVNAVAEAWNALGLGQVQKILPDTERGRLLKKRLQDYGLDAVLKAIRNVGESSFLRGGGGKGWVCTFDWFIKPANFAKVLEGNYADGAATAAGKKVMSAAEYNSRAAGPVNTRDLEKAFGG